MKSEREICEDTLGDLKLRCCSLWNSMYTLTCSSGSITQKKDRGVWVSLYTAPLRMLTAPDAELTLGHQTCSTAVLSMGPATLSFADSSKNSVRSQNT